MHAFHSTGEQFKALEVEGSPKGDTLGREYGPRKISGIPLDSQRAVSTIAFSLN